jgi:argininosuccinate lyase
VTCRSCRWPCCRASPAIEKDVYECLSLRGSLNARNTLGGTAPAQVRAQIARHRARLAGLLTENWVGAAN